MSKGLHMSTSTASTLTRFEGEPIRVLIIPGLHNSGDAHWQTWLQGQYKGAVRVHQQDWQNPDLEAWSTQIDKTMARVKPSGPWIAVAHSFGCLALAHHLTRPESSRQATNRGIQAALMVAPADPIKFGLAHSLSRDGLGIAATVIGSENDPWMPLARAQEWAGHWGAHFQNQGAVGHINTESGFGPWPLARFKVDQMIRYLQRQRRLERAHPMEFSFAI
jgi:uncharacterized protein